MDKVEREHTIRSIRKQVNLEIESGFLEASPDWLKAWYKYDIRYEPAKTTYPTILEENLESLLKALSKAKPASAKGQFIKKISLSTTMGAGLSVDIATLETK